MWVWIFSGAGVMLFMLHKHLQCNDGMYIDGAVSWILSQLLYVAGIGQCHYNDIPMCSYNRCSVIIQMDIKFSWLISSNHSSTNEVFYNGPKGAVLGKRGDLEGLLI